MNCFFTNRGNGCRQMIAQDRGSGMRRNMVLTRQKRTWRTECNAKCQMPNPAALCLIGAAADAATQNSARIAYGSIYTSVNKEITVALPGDVMPIVFDQCSRVSDGMAHTAGEIVVADAGDYEISIMVSFEATLAAFAAIMIQVDEDSLAGGVYSRMLSKGSQTVSGSTIATLEGGAHVRVAITSATALCIKLAGGGHVSASLSVKKLG